MELLIPGLILVALMVYASTKIKKTAAAAYLEESIENDRFVITKPEGMINPINDDSPYLFQAYSKDFGDDDQKNERRLLAIVTAADSAATAVSEIRRSLTRVADEYCLDDATVIEGNDRDYFAAYKVADARGPALVLKILALEKFKEENTGRMASLLQSFRAK